MGMLRMRVWEICACLATNVVVKLNNKMIPFKTFKDFAERFHSSAYVKNDVDQENKDMENDDKDDDEVVEVKKKKGKGENTIKACVRREQRWAMGGCGWLVGWKLPPALIRQWLGHL